MIYLFVIITILIIMVLTLPQYNTSREDFSSDEAIANIASLYNQSNLTVSRITTPNIIGQPNLAIGGNVSIPGKITSPSLDSINTNLTNQLNQINQLSTKINGMQDNINNIAKCNWNGERPIYGGQGCEDDVWINCQNGKVINFRFSC